MIPLITFLLFLVVVGVGVATPAVTQSSLHSVSQCHDWGVSGEGAVRVLEGEAGWLRCPLFSHPTVYNYSSATASGLNLFWYRLSPGQDLEQPINLKLPSYHKDREWLWFQPAATQDTGQYICMLRNMTSCAKIAVRLEVAPRGGGGGCVKVAAVPPRNINIPIEEGRTLTCPDLQGIRLPSSTHSVTWFYKCRRVALGEVMLQIKGDILIIHMMLASYSGLYTCVVTYETNGSAVNFTRAVNVTAVSSSRVPKNPKILSPTKEDVFNVKLGEDVVLPCKAFLPYLEDEQQELWWSINGKTVEQLADPRFTSTLKLMSNHFGDEIKERELHIQNFSPEDLRREYNCSARNSKGFATCRAFLKKEVYLPSVELGCGLGATLFLMLLLFVVYHVFWLELLLLYRSWFGSDERSTDDKEYDVYISYARNSEEEQFVLLTLRRVLENELGYTVCIFDRDSLPGGTITDETLRFVGRSRRLIVVVSPCYVLQGTQALLELKAGLDSMAWGGSLRVILVQYKPVSRDSWVRELRRARVVLALICWKGDKSEELSSRFWKRLQVELPIHRLKELPEREEGSAIPLQCIETDNTHNIHNRHNTHNTGEKYVAICS